MNKIFLNYLLLNFLKTFFIFVLVFYCFGMILNLFEEIEFFKNMNVSFFIPLLLTSIFIPSMIIKILPFIIFISSIWSKFGAKGYTLYCASKGALDSAMRALALELAPITRVNSILFGAIGTAGQRCTTTRRVFVQEKIYNKWS